MPKTDPPPPIRDKYGHFVKKEQINLKVAPPLRDSGGHFIKTTKINVKTTLTAPDGTIINPEFEKPLISVNVNNPFKKLLYWLDQIRRHQTTTFAIKLSIPLIAIPIIIAALFTYSRFRVASLNKVLPTPTPIIKASPKPTPSPSVSPQITVNRSGTLRIAVGNQTTYLLAQRNGSLIVLDVPRSIDLNKFRDKQVLVTGTINSATGILTVTDISEVQVFNPTPTPSPEATQSAK